MKTLELTINKNQTSYPIVIGTNLLEKIQEVFDLEKYSQMFVITDAHVAGHFLKKLPQYTANIILPAGEQKKTIETVQKIWMAMNEAKLDRKALVINLGGGMVGDIGGFAASTYMRGVDFIQIPTTLLAQIDSSVGGKTGINFGGIKNLIGTFNQPVGVLIDTQTLQSLPKREFVSGFAEMIKHGLISDKDYFENVISKKPEEFSQEELVELITRSCAIKKQIVENDETESGSRKLLNFGHTIGHAIEALSLETDNSLLHGEAVSIGMVAEAKISQLRNMISERELQAIKNALNETGLPTSLRREALPDGRQESQINIFKKMHSDKKNEKGVINFTLLSSIGKAVINQNDISEEIINQALKYVTK